MGQTHDEITQHLAERLCWQVARRDDTRIARRRYRKPLVDGVYRLDEGALLDDFFHFWRAIEVRALLEPVHGTAIQREMSPVVQDLLRDGLKTWFGIKSMHALPRLLCSDEALMQLVGVNAQQVRQGGCPRGRTTRQGERPPGPMGPETLANNRVPCNVRDLVALFNGGIRAVAKAGVFDKWGTGMADGTDLETTERDQGCGHAPRQRRSDDKWGRGQESAGTGQGWQLIVLIDARTKLPLAAKVVPIQEHATLSLRALVTQARIHLAGDARLHKGVFDKGVWEGTELWWLDHQGLRFVVRAKAKMAVTAEARAQAAAGDESTLGRRAPTGRHGQGKAAWRERLETEGVGITGLTTDAPQGTADHGRHAHRRDFQPHLITAVVVRTWNTRNYGPGGTTVFLTNASVQQPLQPCDDDDDRSRIETCGIKEAKQQWDLHHPPQKTARAGRVHVMFTLLLFAWATAYRLPGEGEALRGEPGGWQRGRRQLLEQTRDQVIVFAQGYYGMFHIAAVALLMGGKLKDVPPGIGTRQDILAKHGLPLES